MHADMPGRDTHADMQGPDTQGQDTQGQDDLGLPALVRALAMVLDVPEDDWNRKQAPGSFPIDTPRASNGLYRALYLDGVRSPFNAGSVFRTIDAFDFSEVLLSPDCPDLAHRRLQRSARGSTAWIPARRLDAYELEAYLCEGRSEPLPIFALETGGTPADRFAFPVEGVCVVGSEERGVSARLRALCEASAGVVSLPARGRKASMNLSVATGILLWQWSITG